MTDPVTLADATIRLIEDIQAAIAATSEHMRHACGVLISECELVIVATERAHQSDRAVAEMVDGYPIHGG